MIGFYHIKDGMSVCYNQLAKLDKNENVNTEILAKICKHLDATLMILWNLLQTISNKA